MMGPTHAMSGAAAGLGVGSYLLANNLVPGLTVTEVLVVAGITAGAALLPDLDHPSATIARSMGPVTRVIAQATNSLSASVANLTGSRRDKRVTNGHRTFTHTLLFAVLAALTTWFAVTVGGNIAGLAMFFILTTFALHGLVRDRVRKVGNLGALLVAGGLTWAAATALPGTVSPEVLAVAVFVGCVAHMLGDAVTVSGIPALAPFVPIKGKRWANVHALPSFLRFRAAGPADKVFFFLFSAATVVQGGLLLA